MVCFKTFTTLSYWFCVVFEYNINCRRRTKVLLQLCGDNKFRFVKSSSLITLLNRKWNLTSAHQKKGSLREIPWQKKHGFFIKQFNGTWCKNYGKVARESYAKVDRLFPLRRPSCQGAGVSIWRRAIFDKLKFCGAPLTREHVVV